MLTKYINYRHLRIANTVIVVLLMIVPFNSYAAMEDKVDKNLETGSASAVEMGIEEYSGKITADYKIARKRMEIIPEIKNKDVLLKTGVSDLTVKCIKITNHKNYTLSGNDYSVSEGTITIKREFLESYAGNTLNLDLRVDTDNYIVISTIKGYNISKLAYECTKKDSPYPVTYTGKSITPDIKIYGAEEGDYSVKFKKSKRIAIGRYYFTVKGKGDCIGSFTGSFVIKPKHPALIKSVKRTANKAIIKWGKVKNCSGYQVQLYKRAGDGEGSDGDDYRIIVYKKATVKGKNTLSKTFNSAKRSKYTKVRVRAYKTVGSKKYYSDWVYKNLG